MADKTSVSPCNTQPTATLPVPFLVALQEFPHHPWQDLIKLQLPPQEFRLTAQTTSKTQPLSAPQDVKDLCWDVP